MSAGPSTKPTSSRKRRTEGEPAGPRKRSKAPGDQLQRIGDHICAPELQTRRCQNQIPKNGKLVRYCFVCSARHGSDDDCRFKNIRQLTYKMENGGKYYTGSVFLTAKQEKNVEKTRPQFDYPTAWNEDIQPRHVQGLKDVIARSLLPTLEKELDAFTEGNDPIWRAMEQECRPTCDGCMTSIFCGSWMCTLCGREVCEDCLDRVTAAVGSGRPEEYPSNQLPKISVKHHADLKRVISCWRNEGHYPSAFRRISRFTAEQLRSTIDEMHARLDEPLKDIESSAPGRDKQPLNVPTPPPSKDTDVHAAAQPTGSSVAGTSSGATSLIGSPSPSGSRPCPIAIETAIPFSGLSTTSNTLDSTPAIATREHVPVPPMSHIPLTPSPTPPPPPTPSHVAPLPATVPSLVTATNSALISSLVQDYGSDISADDDAHSLADGRDATPVPATPTIPAVEATLAPPLAEPSTAVASGTDAVDLISSRALSVLSELTEDDAPSRASPALAPVPDHEPMETEPTTPPTIKSHETHRFKETDADWNEAHFRELWAQGAPIVVTDILHKFTHAWTPEYFIENYGHQACKLVECQSESEKDSVVADFFCMLGKRRAENGEIWKLKDWPPSSDFLTDFPELYEDFESAVPMPSYTRRDGVFNIASHFPKNALKPDLGPKMYNAFATFETAGSKGSTRLHMDVADAVNIMLWSQRPPEDPSTEPACAAWDIFRAEDANRLRELMREHFEGAEDSDPIHSQKYYLDEDIRRKFAERGVWSHRIYQKAGEAVFIPAGCAHQVCNLADCIKVAADFVSPENIQRCAQLTQEFRRLNFSYHWKEDVLQLRTMMWFAWESCSRDLSLNKRDLNLNEVEEEEEEEEK